MGEIVGAGLLAHVPTIVLPEDDPAGAQRGQGDHPRHRPAPAAQGGLRARPDYDTVVVLDSHWATTVEFVVTAQQRRAGLFTSEELPRGMCRMPYDFPGDPELAHNIEKFADKHGTWITAIDDEYLPIYYATINLWKFLGEGLPDKRWVTIGVCQTGDMEDYLRLGRALGRRRSPPPRAAGSCSSPPARCRTPSGRCASCATTRPSDPAHIFTPEAREADYERIAWFKEGRHDKVLDTMPEFSKYRPEAKFFHYLMMAGALGEQACVATARQYGEYENSIGTGQVHLWFDRPADGWTGAGLPAAPSHAPQPSQPYRGVLPCPSTAASSSTAPPSRSPSTVTNSSPRTAAASRPRTPQHLPPVVPSKVIAVHLNHRSRVDEFDIDLPDAPTYFHKPTSALNSHKGAIVRPEGCKWLNYEGEVAIVIGRTARNISPAEAGEYIAGYTIANDFGLHDFRDTDAGSMLRVKGSDTLCPLGPGLVTDWDFRGKTPAHLRQRRGGPGRVDRRDGVGHALPRRRHRPHHHPVPRRRAAVRHPGQLPPRPAGRRRRGRGRGPGPAHQPHRHRPHRRSAPTSAPSPPSREEVLSTALGGDWEFRGIRPPKR